MIVLPRYATKQPQSNDTTRIHWGNPITNRLVSVFVPVTNLPVEQVSGMTGGPGGNSKIQVEPGFLSNMRIANRTNGIAYNWTQGYTTSTRGIVPSAFNFSQMTLFVLFEQYDTTSTGSIWGTGATSTNHMKFNKNSDGTVSLFPNSNSASSPMISPVLEIDRPYSLAGTHYGANAEFFVDGFSIASIADVGNFLSASYLWFGSQFLSNQSRRIGIYCAYAWTRRLAPLEIKSISANPWQIFRNNTETFSAQIAPALPSSRFLMFFG